MAENLLDLLSAADAYAQKAGASGSPLALDIHLAETGQLDTHHPIQLLLDGLRADPRLEIFAGLMQVVPGHAARVEYGTLADWLLGRVRVVGAANTLLDLERYLGSEEIEYALTVAVDGLEIDQEMNVGAYRLVPWRELSESPSKNTVREHFSYRLNRPLLAVQRTVTLKRLHVPQGETAQYLTPHGYSDVADLLLLLGAIGPTGPVPMAVWFDPPDWAPVVRGSLMLPLVEGHSRRRTLPASAAVLASELLTAWNAAGDARRAELRVPLSRLNSAIRSISTVDIAIDLGIALEAIFLTDLPEDRGELSFRLRMRAARLLGTDAESRRQIGRLVGDLYGVRSSAVHRGTIPTKVRSLLVEELLGRGYSLVAETFVRLLLEGPPDWDAITYG